MARHEQRDLHPNDVFALKHVHEGRLSPDGRLVAYVSSRTDEATAQEFFELTIQDLATAERHRVPFAGGVTCPRWAPDGKSLAFLGLSGDSAQIYLSSAHGESVKPLTSPGAMAQSPFSWSPDGTSIAFTTVVRREPKPAAVTADFRRITTRLFRSEGQGLLQDVSLAIRTVDVRTGVTRSLPVEMPVMMRPLFSPCGKRLMFMGASMPVPYSEAFRKGVKLFVLDFASGRVDEVLGEAWSVYEAAWSACGNYIVFAGTRDSTLTVPNMGLWVVNPDGTNPHVRIPNFTGAIGLRLHHDTPTWSTSHNNVLAVGEAPYVYATVTIRGRAEICRVALEGEFRVQSVVSGQRACMVMDVDPKTDRLLFAASDLHKPWDLYCSRLNGASEQRLTSWNDETLSRWPKLKVRHLEFKSADGLPLEAWILSRADRPLPHPTVLFIHAGPFLATGHVFRFDFQLLAANGYAVLFANFRGSCGYGEEFSRAIMGDWGTNGFPDHMATIDAAVSAGWSDPRRLGVWGASHGGFATCWIVTHSNRFRAAVAESAISNFTTLYYLSDAPHLFAHDLGGRPHEIPDVYRSRSPLTYAWRCQTPTLLVHGEDDLRCPMAEAEQFYRALHDAGCKTELVQIPRMNHTGDSTGPLSARRGQNEALLEWFERHL